MGMMRFLVPRPESLAADAAERCYITGLDEIPWQSRAQRSGDMLTVRRSESDSGCFHIPWNVAGYGELMLATASLMERDRPYHLPVELARGSLHRIRNQIAAWESIGLVVPDVVATKMQAALNHFARAATGQHEPVGAAAAAQEAINAAHDALRDLLVAYAQQSLASRQRQPSRIIKLLGLNLGRAPLKENVQKEVQNTFNAATIPVVWRDLEPREGKRDWSLSDRQMEWCRQAGLKPCVGPLLQLDRGSLPDWLYIWEGEFDNLASVVIEHIRAIVTRYRGKAALWQCAARMNAADILSLTEEQRLRLTVLAVQVARQADAKVPIVLWIDQPWGEYMGAKACDLSPLHFADSLVRADLGLAGLGLEINLGYYPGGTQPRDLLDFSRLVDRWSCLGLPLLVNLTIPSDGGPDAQARLPARVLPLAPSGQASPASQSVWAAELLPLLLAKPSVQGVWWNQLLDNQPHDFAHGGLYDAEGRSKPALNALQAAKRQYLG